jgi:serine/threonine-protein kinase OSR1/STK39
MEFPLDASCYQLLNLVGTGTSSKVYQAKCVPNNEEIAIKIIDLDIYPMDIDYIRQEVAFWSSSRHANIIPYYGSFVAGKDLYILMEYLAGGSLYDIMASSFPHGFKDEIIIATVLQSILSALVCIHQQGQIHRDVKPGNAIIGKDGVIKVGDFGVAATLLEEGQRKRARFTTIGTPSYMAPEVLENGSGHTEKADIWSLGITAIELATGSAPYATLGQLEIVQRILKAPPPQLPRNENFSQEFRDFVKSCMNFNAVRRPSAAELLQHSFIEKAGDPSYIVNFVLKGLPPLPVRYKMVREREGDLIDWESQSCSPLAMVGQSDVSSSAGKVEWDFYEETDKNDDALDDRAQVKKGRFTIQRKAPAKESDNEEMSPLSDDKAVVGVEERVSELERRMADLAMENQTMKAELQRLSEILSNLTSDDVWDRKLGGY